jgi:hypothetical protein
MKKFIKNKSEIRHIKKNGLLKNGFVSIAMQTSFRLIPVKGVNS